MMGAKGKRLRPVALGVGFGGACGIFMLALAWAGWLIGGEYGKAIINLSASVHPGFAATFIGGIVGFVWGFVKGFIFGVLSAWIYNLCLCCCPASNGCCETGSCEKCR